MNQVRRPVLTIAPLLSLFLAGASTLSVAGETDLTPAAAAAVKSLFPTGSIVGVGQETEAGVSYFEVAVRDGERRIEVEVTADGSIGEVEFVVAIADLPRAVADGIARLAGGTPVEHAERHEVRGVPRNGTFAPLEPARVLYEVSYMAGGIRHEATLDGNGKPIQQKDDDLEEEEEGDTE